MVTNPEILQKFEIELEQKINHSYSERLKIFEDMLRFKNSILKDANPLDGLDEKIDFIRRLHKC